MHWLKQLEPKSFSQLQNTYTSNLSKENKNFQLFFYISISFSPVWLFFNTKSHTR